MISVSFDLTQFNATMKNAEQYTDGFMDGFMGGGQIVSAKIGAIIETMLGKYIDSLAASSPASLHHVYEWGQTGSAGGRLFNISANADGGGVTVVGTFSQSSSVAPTATEPFYNKAEVMEAGTPVTITPAEGTVLHFFDDGEEFFIPNTVTVNDPGGAAVQGSFARTFHKFFSFYFSQSVLEAVGFSSHLRNPLFSESFAGGYSGGMSSARRWLLTLPGGETIA